MSPSHGGMRLREVTESYGGRERHEDGRERPQAPERCGHGPMCADGPQEQGSEERLPPGGPRAARLCPSLDFSAAKWILDSGLQSFNSVSRCRLLSCRERECAAAAPGPDAALASALRVGSSQGRESLNVREASTTRSTEPEWEGLGVDPGRELIPLSPPESGCGLGLERGAGRLGKNSVASQGSSRPAGHAH